MAIAVRNKSTRNIKRKFLLPDPLNWHTHPEAQRNALAAIFREVGFVGYVLVRPTPGKRNRWYVVDGHERIEHFGPDEPVPCAILDIDEAEARKLLAAYDSLGYLAGIDQGKLDALISEVDFDEAELEETLKGIGEIDLPGNADEDEDDGGEATEDDPPPVDKSGELQKKWKTKKGQLWEITGPSGNVHRLLCGDSHDRKSRRRLLGDDRCDVAVIDPPFNLDNKWTVHLIDPSIVFGQASHVRAIPDHLWRFERIIDKGHSHRSATTCVGQRHAFIVQCGTEKHLPRSGETFDSIVEMGDQRGTHRHAKSVELIVEHLRHWTPAWERAFDPYAGSGTTMVAAEQLGRVCYGMEIEPKDCAVIFERMKNLGAECRLAK